MARNQDKATWDALAELVSHNVGAQLEAYHQLGEADGSTGERTFIVLWRNEREWGTHAAWINLEETAMSWGHYMPDIHRAYIDYCKRIGVDKA